MTPNDAMSAKMQRNPLRLILLLAVAAFFGIAVHQHLFSVNSHYYFTWTWQWIASKTVYPIVLPLAIPFFIGQMLYSRRPSRLRTALIAIMVSKFALMLGAAAVQKNPPSLTRISDVIQSRWTTGYFEEATALKHRGITAGQLLTRYPTLLGNFYLHARQKPPGPMLFEIAMNRLFGSGEAGAMASGLLIGVVATLAVPAVYAFIAFFTGNRDAAFLGAGYFALCPSPILFFPQFDQCYPIFTVCITVLWAMSLKNDDARFSAALGFVYALTSLTTWAPGVLVIFLAGAALLKYMTDPQCGFARIFRHFAISLATFAAFHLAFWALTGFNLIATFRACVQQEHLIASILTGVYHYRPHHLPGTIPADLYNFALGSGWISFLLVGFYFARDAKKGVTSDKCVALICVAQFIIVAVCGLLPTETARIWIFMFPMLMLPIGLELAKWRPWERMAVYAVLLLLTAAMCQSMQFIDSAM